MLDWIKYSGASITVVLNPWQWKLFPSFKRQPNDGWPSPNQQSWRFCWVWCAVDVWVDNGVW